MRKILFFRKALTQEGGAERLLFEIADLAKDSGFESRVVILGGNPDKLFDGHFSHIKVDVLFGSDYPKDLFSKIAVSFGAIFKLRKAVKEINPDFILAQGPDEAEVLYFALLGTHYRYSTFIHQSLFWCPDDVLKYFFPFRKHFKEVRDSVWGHEFFIPEKAPALGLTAGIAARLRAILSYLAVRKAENIFVPSSVMGREVSVLYGRGFVPLKMGVDEKMFDYLPRQDVKKKLGIGGKKLILEVSRLDSQKRMDLAIRAFGEIAAEFPDVCFAIGGKGPERERLENLVKELNLGGRVILLGYVAESDLKDLHASCDVAFHPAWIDFDISFMEPLTLGKKVVCSTEYELVDNLLELKGELIFPADPTVSEMSRALKTALLHRPKKKESMRELLSDYTWSSYTKKLLSHFVMTDKKMKIAFLISHPIQVYASFFRSLSRHPDIDLTVYFCIRWGAEEFFDPEFAQTYKWDIPIVEGYKHVFLKNYSSRPSNGFFGQINPGIIGELRREKYDAVIIHGYTAVTNWLAFFGALLTKTPIFFRGISHILDEKPGYIRALKRVILPLLFKICAACLYIGKNNKDYYRQYGVPEEKLFFVPHIVDNDFFRGFHKKLKPERGKIRESFGFHDDRPVVLFTGKLIPKKRPLLLLEVYEKIRKEYPCGLMFAGDGRLRGEIEARVRKNKIPDVVITGFLNQTEIPRAYVSGDILVLPSGEGETWGLVVNEGMNFELPIIVSDRVGCGPDLVRENENGYVFSSPEDLYDALLKLVVSKETRIRFGKKSGEIINTWGIPECVENIVGALHSAGKKRNSVHER